ncbi:unnamed protein product [Cochlearia groenlandica]
MDLALHFPCTTYPLIKQRFRQAKQASHLLHVQDTNTSSFEKSLLRTTVHGERSIRLQEKASSSFSKKGHVSCKKQSNSQSSNPSKSNQEEIISLLKRIQASISKGESRGDEEKKNSGASTENKPLTKAILDVLEKSRKNTQGDTTSVKEKQPKRQEVLTRQPSSFTKRTHTPSALTPRGKLPVTKTDKALEEITEKQEKPPLIETMKLAELKEVAKNSGIKGYSKLKKSELLKRLRSS